MSGKGTGALVIIFDVGNSVSTPDPSDKKTFFEKSRDCISWILRRKILSMSNDLVCILVTGTDEEGESLDDIDVTLCRNISIKYDFQLSSWEMLYYIDNEVKPKDKVSDWVGTLSVAIEKLKILEEFSHISSKTVAVFSDLSHTFTDAIESVLEGIKSCGIEVNIIGSDCFSQSNQNEECDCEEPSSKKLHLEDDSKIETGELMNGEDLLSIMCDKVGESITVCNFNSAMKHLSFYVRKKCRPMPWNCVMDIGSFKINIQLFKKVDRKPQHRPSLKCLRYDEEVNAVTSQPKLSQVKRDKIMYYNHFDEDLSKTREVYVEEGDLVAGYRYGASLIPFSDEDNLVLGYKPGKKCFSILGFTHADNVPYYSLVGEGCYIVAPRDKDECAEKSLSALVQAMSETENVAIVRRVYSDDRGLSLGVLYPVFEEQGESNYKECLIFIELAFHEETRITGLPSLRRIKTRISEEQYSLIDNIIDEMNLTHSQSDKEDQTCEELDLSMRHEIKDQFFSHCIVQKALYPDKPLPKDLSEYCLKSLILSDGVSFKGEKFNEKLRELFFVRGNQIQESDSYNYKNDSRASAEVVSSFASFTENEKTAESCFRKLFEMYKYPPVQEIQSILELSLTSLNFKEDEIIEAFLKMTREIREKTIQNFTDDYNFWMRTLRIHLGAEKPLEMGYWDGVLKYNLGLITEEEHKDSNTRRIEADFFITSLMPNKEVEAEQMTISKEVDDAINALL